MSDYTVTLTISEAVYNRARRLAENTAQPMEQILSNRLEEVFDDSAILPPDELVELAAFRHLSNEALWTIAREQTPSDVRERVSVLLALNKRATLTTEEQSELDQLLNAADRVMLRKAEASALLTQRGFKISPEDMARRE